MTTETQLLREAQMLIAWHELRYVDAKSCALFNSRKDLQEIAAGHNNAISTLRGLIAALSAPAQPASGEADTGPQVLRQVFELCEATEEAELSGSSRDSQAAQDFMRGRKFEAKQIRKAIGIWFQDEFCGRSFMGEPVSTPPASQERVASELERIAYEAPVSGNLIAQERVLMAAARIRGGQPASQEQAAKARAWDKCCASCVLRHVQLTIGDVIDTMDALLAQELAPSQEQAQPSTSGLFEFWWEAHMPKATQTQAWAAWQAAHDSKGAGIEAQPSGEVVAWLWQHDETGRTGFVDQWQVDNGWQAANPRLALIRPLTYADTAPQPAQAARVALTDEQANAERYTLLRRGQHWSVIDGIGDTLRGDDLDAAVDAVRGIGGITSNGEAR